MKIGQILLNRRAISREHLRVALARQARDRRPLGEILIDMGVVSRADAVDAMRSQPHGSVDAATVAMVDAATARTLPETIARNCTALPLANVGGSVIVAMADPTDRDAITRISAACGRPVVAVAGPADAIERAIDSIHGSGAPTQRVAS